MLYFTIYKITMCKYKINFSKTDTWWVAPPVLSLGSRVGQFISGMSCVNIVVPKLYKKGVLKDWALSGVLCMLGWAEGLVLLAVERLRSAEVIGSVLWSSNKLHFTSLKVTGWSPSSLLNCCSCSTFSVNTVDGISGVSGVLCKKAASLSVGGNLTLNWERDSTEFSSSSWPIPLGAIDGKCETSILISFLTQGLQRSSVCSSVHWIGFENGISVRTHGKKMVKQTKKQI